MAKSVKSSGELREFLINMMVGVKDGHQDIESARTIVKIAGQINESLYSEIKAAKLNIDAGRATQDWGQLQIGKVEVPV